MSKHTDKIAPIQSKDRSVILDALRGFALMGICLANFPEFSLYTFLNSEITGAMPTAGIDKVIRYLQYILIDGKFYTLFSLLFGIGFSIIIANRTQKGRNGFHIFYRRMGILLLIGFLHLMFIWSGDILMLYALLGLLLPLFRNCSNRRLLKTAAFFLLLPIVIDAVTMVWGIQLSSEVVRVQQQFCARYGITDDNFGFWLRDTSSYTEVFQFLIQGAFVRMQEFIDGNRAFKVLGLFLLGFYIGRNKLYARLSDNKRLLKLVALFGMLIGLPLSLPYAWSAIEGHPWGLTIHSVLYTFSVFPLALSYAAAFCLCYVYRAESQLFRVLAAPGRMALSNYIGQSLWGIVLFYGIGLGLGANTGLVYVLLIAAGVYIFEILFSLLWLHYCRFGPLEWIWRMLTYGKWLQLLK